MAKLPRDAPDKDRLRDALDEALTNGIRRSLDPLAPIFPPHDPCPNREYPLLRNKFPSPAPTYPPPYRVFCNNSSFTVEEEQKEQVQTKIQSVTMRPSSSGHSPLELPQLVAVPGCITVNSVSPDAVSPADSQPPPRRLSPATALSKVHKVSRACDFCKSRKSRCSGTHPCTQCTARGQKCLFNAKYTRGRPRTPPPAAASSASSSLFLANSPSLGMEERSSSHAAAIPAAFLAPSQTQSPPQSSVSSSLSRPDHELADNVAGYQHSLTFAGDRPLPELDHVKLDGVRLGDRDENRMLLALYFDFCIATYRVLHRPSTEQWLEVLERNLEAKRPMWHDLGHGRAAIVMAVLAIATLHSEKSKGLLPSNGDDGTQALRCSDELFNTSSWLSRADMADCPALEMVQAGILQVLYLLQTSRFNKAWYVFGNTIPIIWMIGLHRKESSRRVQISKLDYIQQQCRQRTFWTAYTLDNYLRIVFGRPRHFHDEDIDQHFPDRINDADMTSTLSGDFTSARSESDVDGLIFHAKYAFPSYVNSNIILSTNP